MRGEQGSPRGSLFIHLFTIWSTAALERLLTVLCRLFDIHVDVCLCLCVSAEASAYEESICNEGSVCGSDSTFYKQTEGENVFRYYDGRGKEIKPRARRMSQ